MKYRKTLLVWSNYRNLYIIGKHQGREKQMKVTRSYATSDKAINVKKFIQQLVNIELEKMVNTDTVNSPASHEKITLGGDYA